MLVFLLWKLYICFYCKKIFNYCIAITNYRNTIINEKSIKRKRGIKMKKFVLNLLTVITWIYQVLCVFSIVTFVLAGGFTIFVLSQPGAGAEISKGMSDELGVQFSSTWIWLMLGMFCLFIVAMVAQFLICGYARLIIKNIKQEIYFAVKNLQLLKKLLISVSVYTVATIIFYIGIYSNYATLTKIAKTSSVDMIYPTSITNSLFFLAILYVVYLVFKYGMKVQEDADSII